MGGHEHLRGPRWAVHPDDRLVTDDVFGPCIFVLADGANWSGVRAHISVIVEDLHLNTLFLQLLPVGSNTGPVTLGLQEMTEGAGQPQGKIMTALMSVLHVKPFPYSDCYL